MRQYKGYYIDKVVFSSTADIDAFIKEQAINKYHQLCKMFAEDPSNELVAIMLPYEDRLHNEFGLSYDEIEQIEIAACAA